MRPSASEPPRARAIPALPALSAESAAAESHEQWLATLAARDTPDSRARSLVALARLEVETEAHFEAVSERLSSAPAPAVAAARLEEAAARFRESVRTIRVVMEHEAPGGRTLRDLLAASVEGRRGRAARPVRGSLPHRSLSLAPRPLPSLSPIVPSYADPLAAAATSDDLIDSPEAPRSPAILAQAASLGFDYARIYDFVRNDIRTEWYQGSQKGAEGALASGAANDVDKASLLITLFRSSQLPARYVRGVLRLDVEPLAAAFGLADDQQVPIALARAGVPHEVVIAGSRIAAVDVLHTWVAAYAPYANYRGVVIDTSGKTWVPLAPAVQGVDRSPPTRVLEAMGFDSAGFVTDYLATEQPDRPLEQIRREVEAFLGDDSYAEQLGARSVAVRRLELLPSGLPTPLATPFYEGASLPAEEETRLRIVASVGATGSEPSLESSLPLASVTGRRLTLSYTPASADDDAIVNLFGGLDLVPPYLVELLPQVKVDGRLVALGTIGVPMAVHHLVRLEVEAAGTMVSHEFLTPAVAYSAIALHAPGDRAQADAGDDPADTEFLAARLLSRVAYRYSESWSAAEDELAGLLDVAVARPLPAVALAHNRIGIEQVFDVPLRIHWEGVDLDAALRIAEPLPNGAPDDTRSWFRLSALEGSSLERRVLETEFQVEAVSADRGLGLARDIGTTVERLDPGNVDAVLDALDLPANVETRIRQQVLGGFEVELPDAPVGAEAWSGTVWRAVDSVSGSAGYFLAGGLAGGATTTAPPNWVLEFLAQALAAPYSLPPNTDPLGAAELRKLPEGDDQYGTVGDLFVHRLEVQVRDLIGRPVEGAEVTFLSERGGGLLVDEDDVELPLAIVTTDRRGVAGVRLRAGTDVSDNPTYLHLDPDDPFPAQALAHEVGAFVDGLLGIVSLDLPFRAIAFPTEAVGLERVDTDQTHFTGRVGFLSDIIPIRAVDEFGNAVSNVPLRFEVAESSGPDPDCTNPSPHVLNAVLVLPGDFSSCHNGLPAIGYCGEPELERMTSSFPASAGVVLGSSASSLYTVLVSAIDAPELGSLAFTYAGLYEISSTNGTCSPGTPILEAFDRHLLYSPVRIDGMGNNIQAAPVGANYPEPLVVHFAAWDPDDPEDDGDPPLEAGSWTPATGNVYLSTAPGTAASTTPTVEIAPGVFSTVLTTDVVAAYNPVHFEATEITSVESLECPPCSLDCPGVPGHDCLEDCIEIPTNDACINCPLCTLDCPGPDCDADCPVDGPIPASECVEESGRGAAQTIDWGFFGIPRLIDPDVNGVWGVDPQLTGFAPDPIPLDGSGSVEIESRIGYSTEPLDYVAATADVELFADGDWVSSGGGSSLSGSGEARIQRGFPIDLDATNEARLVLNRGSPAEVRSPLVELPLTQGIFEPGDDNDDNDLVGRRQLYVSQDVDLTSRRVCSQPDLFYFTLTQEASVTLTFEKLSGVDTDGTPQYDPPEEFLLNEILPEGEHSYSVTAGAGAGDLTLGPGDYRFTLVAEGTATGLVESFEGTARSELRASDSLPLGHVLVEGVDLFDGHLTLQREDLEIPGRGSHLAFRRTYSSSADRDPGPLGVGWTHNYASFVTITPCGEVIVVGGEGSGMRFVDDGAGGLTALAGYHGGLVASSDDNSFDFFSLNGTRFHYEPDPRSPGRWPLRSIEDTNGNLTQLFYDPNTAEPLVAAVVDPAGRRLEFGYENRVFEIVGEVELRSKRVLTSIDGPAGLEMRFEYDDFGHLVRAAREGDARVEFYGYDWVIDPLLAPQRALVSTTNALTGATTVYQGAGGLTGIDADIKLARLRTTSVTRPEGGVTRFVYDDAGLLDRTSLELSQQVIDPRGFATTYRLNQYGAPLAITDPLGHTTAMTWDLDDVVMTSRTDANGHTTSYTHDEHGNVLTEEIEVTDADDAVHLYRRTNTYHPPADFDPPFVKERLASRTDRDGDVTTFEYDTAGNLTRSATVVGTATIETRHGYLANGDRASTTDPRGAITQFGYDAYGNLASVLDPLGHETTTEWDERSRAVRVVDALERETLLAYDTLDRVTTRSRPLGAIETTAYDDVASTVTTTDAEGRVTVERRDLEGRTVETTNPEGGTKLVDYDPAGNKVLETLWFDAATPRHDVTFEYDDAGRLLRRHEPLGRTTEFGHDAVGNVTSEVLSDATDAGFAVRRMETEYDALDRAIRKREFLDARPLESRMLLDGEGNLLRETDPLGRVTDHAYDELDRRVETLEPQWRPAERKRTTFEYDANGNLVREVRANDPADQERTFTWDPLNRALTTTDATGGTTSFEYDAVGNRIRETDPNGNVTAHAYDELDRLVATLQHLTRVSVPPRVVTTTYGYDRVGNRVSEEWPNGNVVTHTYDGLDRLLASADSLGPLTAATYDARGNPLAESDANGNLTTSTWDALDRLVEQELPEARTLAFTWDVAGNRLSATDARGATTGFSYDTLDRQIEITHPETEGVVYIESFTWDDAGNRLTATDRRGLTTTFAYDDLDRLVSVTDPDPLGFVTSYGYDAEGNRTSETDRRGILSRTDYDAENRPVRIERDGLTLRTIAYDAAGNRILEVDAEGRPIESAWDERDLLVETRYPLEDEAMAYVLDDLGDRLETRVGEGVPDTTVSTATWDLRRRMESETNAVAETTGYEYDGNGNRTAMVRPKSTRWEYDFDGADRLVAVRDPLGNETTYGYDGNGNLTSQTDAENRTTTFAWDALNRRLRRTYPDSAFRTATWDGNGNQLSATDALGRTTTFGYDELNRLTTTAYPLPNPPTGDDLVSITTTYDANGNPTEVVESYTGATGTRTTSRAFDTFDRLTAVTDGHGETLGYQYTASGNRARLTDPDAKVTRYEYDSKNRTTRVEITGSGTTEYAWLPTDDLAEIRYPEGTVAAYGYDTPGRVTSIEHTRAAALVSRFDYVYDPNGNRLTQREQRFDGTDELTGYTYDDADRLTEVAYPDQTVTHTYDGVSNRLTETTVDPGGTTTGDLSYAYNDRHQLTAVTDHLDPTGDVAWTWDPNGNQTSKTEGGTATTTYTYDLRDRLIEIANASGLLGRYRFDHQGLRISKESAAGTEHFVWDDQALLLTTDATGTTRAKHNYGPRNLLSVENAGATRYYLTDVLGSPFQISNADGSVDTYRQYDAWGEVRSEVVGDADQRFGFTGYQADGESGLLYAKARFYDGAVGRFGREDPFEGEGLVPPSLHRYLYGYANPAFFVDPDGRQVKWQKEDDIPEGVPYFVVDQEMETGGSFEVFFSADPGAWSEADPILDGSFSAVRDRAKERRHKGVAVGRETSKNLLAQLPGVGRFFTEKVAEAAERGRSARQSATRLNATLDQGLTRNRGGDTESYLAAWQRSTLADVNQGTQVLKESRDEAGIVVRESARSLGAAIEAAERLSVLSLSPRVAGRLFAASRLRGVRGLGNTATSPWLEDSRDAVVAHLEEFREGASYLVPESTYVNWIKGKKSIGRVDGQFVTTRVAMDRLLSDARGRIGEVKRKLGIPADAWNEPLYRIDVDSPLLFNARLPMGVESGANDMFRWGGYTSGGLPEAVIDQVPSWAVSVSAVGVRP